MKKLKLFYLVLILVFGEGVFLLNVLNMWWMYDFSEKFGYDWLLD